MLVPWRVTTLYIWMFDDFLCKLFIPCGICYAFLLRLSRLTVGMLMADPLKLADLRYIRREPGLHLVDAKDVVVLSSCWFWDQGMFGRFQTSVFILFLVRGDVFLLGKVLLCIPHHISHLYR